MSIAITCIVFRKKVPYASFLQARRSAINKETSDFLSYWSDKEGDPSLFKKRERQQRERKNVTGNQGGLLPY